MNTVEITYNGKTYNFTDSWVEGDINGFLYSDFCYEILDSEEAIDALDQKIIEEVDGVIHWTDCGKCFLFTNENVDHLLSEIDDWGYIERESGATGIYEDN